MKMYIDGAARGNPGQAGAGVVLCDASGATVEEAAHYLGDQLTNNVAEYEALLYGLRLAATQADCLTVFSDSELLVKQMNGLYKVKKPHLKTLHSQAQNLLKSFSEVSFEHIRREKNRRADALANKAIDERLV